LNRFLLFFFRLVVMAFGFFCACFAAAAVAAFLTRFFTPDDVRTLGDTATLAGVVLGILYIAAVIAYAAMMPAMFIVIFAEMRRRRTWLFYVLSGGSLSALILAFVLLNPQQSRAPGADFLAITIVAGMIGGAVYWLVAGRTAGGWLPRQIKRARLERQQAEAPKS
jgi:Na+(H+)/acetate symporter ActP